jgi:hypothetical protein
MMPPRLIFILVVCAALLMTSGCVANRSYRRANEVNPPQMPMSVDISSVASDSDCVDNPATPLSAQPLHYYLAHIEFDDMGELWSTGNLTKTQRTAPSSQLDNAIEVIKRGQTLANKEGRQLVVIAFVHGWHNNASDYDERHKNLHDFKSMMQTLSCEYTIKTVNSQPTLDKRAVLVGIFLSWRGQSLPADFAFTYWGRRDAATRIGGPSMTEVVTRLMFETKGVPLAPSPGSDDCTWTPVKGKESAHFAIIAHSFGARALEHALAQPMLSMVLERQAQSRECAREWASRNPGQHLDVLSAPAPADLVVFLNAANDAIGAKETIEALKRSQVRIKKPNSVEAESDSAPLMISVTSDGDWATEGIMPIAQWFSSSALAFRRYDNYRDKEKCKANGQLCDRRQGYYYRHSEASIEEMRSHVVIALDDSTSCKNKGLDSWPFFYVQGKDKCFCIDQSGRNWAGSDECGLNQGRRKKAFGSDTGWNNTPFYVIGVPKDLIRGHNDIFQDGTVELLTTISTHFQILLSRDNPATMIFPNTSAP